MATRPTDSGAAAAAAAARLDGAKLLLLLPPPPTASLSLPPAGAACSAHALKHVSRAIVGGSRGARRDCGD